MKVRRMKPDWLFVRLFLVVMISIDQKQGNKMSKATYLVLYVTMKTAQIGVYNLFISTMKLESQQTVISRLGTAKMIVNVTG